MKKCALVTGGSRGIGRSICIKMAELDYHVIVNYKDNMTAAAETLKEIREIGGEGELLPFDVKDKHQVKQVLSSWMEANPQRVIEVLVNNAGIKDDTLMMWMKDEQWEQVLNTNLSGFFYVTREILSQMLIRKYGRIINIVSLSGIKGMPGQVNYSGAKAGLIGATKALAQEVARRGVTVNAVAPGFIKTDLIEGLNENELKILIPVQRFGNPEEVAHAVGFLVDQRSGYITGQVISVNGGLYT